MFTNLAINQLSRSIFHLHFCVAEKSPFFFSSSWHKKNIKNALGFGASKEDFSAKKCLDAVEQNPPYVQPEEKTGPDPAGSIRRGILFRGTWEMNWGVN